MTIKGSVLLFRKKPVVIEALRWTGFNYHESEQFIGPMDKKEYEAPPLGAAAKFITTLEGRMRCDPGDWIIKGVNGEFYPCKPDIFEKTYEPADDLHYPLGCKCCGGMGCDACNYQAGAQVEQEALKEVDVECEDLVRRFKDIEAIKLYRNKHGTTLREAHDAIRRMKSKQEKA